MDVEVNSVSAHGSILVHSFMQEFNDVDQSMTYLTFDSGAAADIESSRNAFYGYDIRGEIMGTEGSIVIGSLRNHDITIHTYKGSTQDIVPSFPVRFNSAYLLEMEHFIDCLRKNVIPSVTVVDGLKALEIAVAAKKSFETGINVKLFKIYKKSGGFMYEKINYYFIGFNCVSFGCSWL